MNVIMIDNSDPNVKWRLCQGDGSCFEIVDPCYLKNTLLQDSRRLIYKKNEYTMCPYDCELKQCPNFEYCQRYLPEDMLKCYDGFCLDCYARFSTVFAIYQENGKLFECPICLENKKCIKNPKCEHLICLECFKITRDSELNKFNEEWQIYGRIKFPLPRCPTEELHKEWEDDRINNTYYQFMMLERVKWGKYEWYNAFKARIFEIYLIKMTTERLVLDKNKNLMKCPICRIPDDDSFIE